MKNRLSFFIVLCLITGIAFAVLFSCSSIGTVAGIGAQVAAAAGVINQNTADAISDSSEAINRAGEAFEKVREDITPEQEYYIGRAVGANILTNYKLYAGNPALTAYLNRICSAIVINSEQPEIYNGYHVNILDSDEINAFATSGGHIFITQGLIACTGSEDALAGVIAHEIAHIQEKHSLKAIKSSRFSQAVLATASAAAVTAGNAGASVGGMNLAELTEAFDESVNDVVTTLVNNGYSQSQEFDADSKALRLMAGAGYEPSALIDMLRSLEKNQGAHPGGFNKTHPSPAQRISSAQKAAGGYKVPDTRSFRQARYQAVK
jgi:predicted Zn-dependent protease